MLANPFREWLAEVGTDAVVVRPYDITAEASGNLWSFSLSPEQVVVTSIVDVEAFAVGVAEGRREWLAARRSGPMVLYWWHDAQAGQLRFSLVSAAHGRLPFGGEVVAAASFAAVASDWLGSPHLQGIAWDELRTLFPDVVTAEPPPVALPVWSLLLAFDT